MTDIYQGKHFRDAIISVTTVKNCCWEFKITLMFWLRRPLENMSQTTLGMCGKKTTTD